MCISLGWDTFLAIQVTTCNQSLPTCLLSFTLTTTTTNHSFLSLSLSHCVPCISSVNVHMDQLDDNRYYYYHYHHHHHYCCCWRWRPNGDVATGCRAMGTWYREDMNWTTYLVASVQLSRNFAASSKFILRNLSRIWWKGHKRAGWLASLCKLSIGQLWLSRFGQPSRVDWIGDMSHMCCCLRIHQSGAKKEIN